MDMAIAKLNSGGWVHIFPEGSRSRDGGRTMGSAKKGVGRLVLDSDNIPVVVPFVHIGMQDIMPVGAKFPHIGKEVTVLMGEPIYFDDLLINEDQTEDRGDLYDAVSSRIGNSLQELKIKAERLAIEQALQAQNHTSSGSERAADLLQQIDWESLGMKSYIICENKNNLSISSENSLAESRRKSYFMDQKRKYTSDRYFSVRLSYDGGMVSRIKGYMDPTELMGFAARGLFMNG